MSLSVRRFWPETVLTCNRRKLYSLLRNVFLESVRFLIWLVINESYAKECRKYMVLELTCYQSSRTMWSRKSKRSFVPELSGQHCLGPVLVRFLSGFSGKFCLVSVRCPVFVRICCPVSVCPARQGHDNAVRLTLVQGVFIYLWIKFFFRKR